MPTGYFDNQGQSGTAVTWANPQVVPENQRQSGGWYYNPETGRVDRWWAAGTGPNPSGGGTPSGPKTAADIIKEQEERTKKAIQEQLNFLKDFQGSNPFAFDEAMARTASEAKFRPYFEEQLQDFIVPLQDKITRSAEDQERILTEMVRRRDLGETQKLREIETGLERTRQGFAGSGLFDSGIARRAEAVQEIGGKEQLGDFLAQSEFNIGQTQITGERERADALKSIEQKKRDILGKGRALDTAVTQDVLSKKSQAQTNYGTLAQQAYTDRFGSPTVGSAGQSAGDYISRGFFS